MCRRSLGCCRYVFEVLEELLVAVVSCDASERDILVRLALACLPLGRPEPCLFRVNLAHLEASVLPADDQRHRDAILDAANHILGKPIN